MEGQSTADAYAYTPLQHDEENGLDNGIGEGPQLINFRSKEVVDDRSSLSWLSWKEMRLQCTLAGPLVIGNLLSFCLQLISLTFVGHFGELELSGASVANSFAVVTGFSIVLGMGCAMETLCGQAYGAKQYKKMGIYLQRAIVVLNVTSVPLAFIWANMEKILVALKQDANIARTAGEYMVWLIPTLFGNATSQPFAKFLQAQSLVAPLLWISLCVLACHVPICWFLVFKSGMGFIGAALANSISYWIDVILLALYVRFSPKCAESRAPLSLEALHDLKGFLTLAIPSAAMICLEWWSYEVLVILSGFLLNPELQTAAISICVSTESLVFMLPLGLSAAASIRVSNELGAGHPQTARKAVYVAVVLALSEALLVAVVILLVRNVWGGVYSSEREVVVAVASLMPLLALSTTFDGLQAVFSGVARGAGWQKAGAIINLGSFYVVGLPVGCVLAFVLHLEGKGLWLGLTLGAFVQFFIFVIITHFTDWQKEAMKAAMRVEAYPSLEEPILDSGK
ncbi:hypothetical protein GOP47_0025564 [Adiantum capillus-veneris]|uniref:Protein DETOXIFICATION n=1 Tax=Adiantum capillus-veneris TaxID=13818 RepID=A0A9D4Z323_ADICA|nr:hypothetical protein GOP47_0025564 [Adiantum capillus-veneris]